MTGLSKLKRQQQSQYTDLAQEDQMSNPMLSKAKSLGKKSGGGAPSIR